MQLPVTLVPRPSLTLAVALLLAHGAAGLGLVLAGLPLGVKAFLFTGLAVSLVFSLRSHVLRPAFRSITLKPDGRLELEDRDGRRQEGRVEAGTTVSRRLVVLRLALEKSRTAVTLLPDALGPDQHRCLRLWLRWKAETDQL